MSTEVDWVKLTNVNLEKEQKSYIINIVRQPEDNI
jgi:hypothetical protein